MKNVQNTLYEKGFMIAFFTKEGEQKKGPLELIWDLIQKYEVDIFKVSLKRITNDFLNYVKENLIALEQKSSFSKMAAELIFYKSKQLLPNFDDEKIDNRAFDRLPDELIEKLLEYKRLQVAAEHLSNTQNTSQKEISRKPEWQLYETGMDFFKLELQPFLKVFQEYLLNEESSLNRTYNIYEEEIEVEQLQKWLHKKLMIEEKSPFLSLIEGASLLWIICLFLAMLEMAKQKMIQISQMENKEIFIQLI